MDNLANKLDGINSSVLDSIHIMEVMGLNSDDLIEPSRFSKFKEIVEKLGNVPNRDFLLKKLTLKKAGTDVLSVVWEYLKIAEEKDLYQKELDKLNDSKEILVKFSEEKGSDIGELESYSKHFKQIKEFESKLKNIDEELSLYEN
jgi:hypothetical protein